MRQALKAMLITTCALLMLSACGAGAASGERRDAQTPLKVVTSFSLLSDMATVIGGSDVDVHNLVPVGVHPHDYEPRPADIRAAADADLLLYNGLNLEGGEHGWLIKLTKVVGQGKSNLVEVASEVKPLHITDSKGRTEVNPHAFPDPNAGIVMATTIRDAFIQKDPHNADEYEARAADYITKLKAMDEKYSALIAEIPPSQRVLVTSERAFQYLAKTYGLKEGFLWSVDTDETGTPEQIKYLVTFIEENDVPGLFVESNVDRRPMQTVATETGVEIDGVLMSDEIGKPGKMGDSYLEYLDHNITTIHRVLAP